MPTPIERPMKADKVKDMKGIRFPVLATPKVDGIRCVIVKGKALSNTLKPIPNQHVREVLEEHCWDGFDGELVLPGVKTFAETSSAIMSRGGKPNFRYDVFDWLGEWADDAYEDRISHYADHWEEGIFPTYIGCLKPTPVKNLEELLEYEAAMLAAGYEGVMIRDPRGPYKFGRATWKEQYLLKIKRFEDREARIVGVEELCRNDNPLEFNELGLAQRSSHKANKVPMGTLGAFIVQDLGTGVEFKIGTGDGLTQELRQQLWNMGAVNLYGLIIKYKTQPFGMKDKPRIPVFLGFRSSLPLE